MALSMSFLIVSLLAFNVVSQLTPTTLPLASPLHYVPKATTYTLKGCMPAADPDNGKPKEGCSCENWNGYLPLLASSGTGMCAYSIITALPSSSNNLQALATTVATTTNGFEVEYWISTKTVAHKTAVVTVSTEWFPSSTASKAVTGSGVSSTFGMMSQAGILALAFALGISLYFLP